LQDAFTLGQLETMIEAQRDQCLLSVDVILRDLPAIEFDEESTYYFLQGQPIWKSAGINASGMLRAYGPQGVFLGVAENMGDGRIAPRRLVSC
jgi:tRNA pseudouridine55 synthase